MLCAQKRMGMEAPRSHLSALFKLHKLEAHAYGHQLQLKVCLLG